MKIQIELDDNLLRSAVEAQVGIALAKFTGEALDKMATEVIQRKLDRFDPVRVAEQAVASQVRKHIDETLANTFGRGWNTSQGIKKIVSDAALAAVQGALK